MTRLNPIALIMLALTGLPLLGCAEEDDGSQGMEADGTSVPSDPMPVGGSEQPMTGEQPMAGAGAVDPMMPAMPDAPVSIAETAVAAGSFTKLAAALTKAGLVEALQGDGPFTVFAPTDAAFEAFEAANPGVLASLSVEQLTAILTYHVVAGADVRSTDLVDGGVVQTLNGAPALIGLRDGAKINDASVTTADMVASNGVIHVIDSIIQPPEKDIVETALDAGTFTALAGALTDAGLVETLQGDGPFTVFAPTDDAFAALAEVPSGDALTDVLLYHVVDGVVGSGNLVAGDVQMLSGDSVTVALEGGVTVDGASVTSANILAKNGVIHVVDSVLVPQ
jgi:transforming growth factor-beta-induced protein